MGALTNVCTEVIAVKSMSSDFDSSAWNIRDLDVGSADVLWSGADGEGVIKWKLSNDKVNWCEMEGSECEISGASGHQGFDFDRRLGFKYMKACWTNTDNTAGTMTISVVKKNERP